MLKTAGIIIIGDEILSGRVQDCNSLFMAKELRIHGIDLRRITVIADNIDEISREVEEASRHFDFVFTSGGIGPTHDDITIEGISKAFGVKTTIDDYLKGILTKKYGKNLTSSQLKLAEVPKGSDLIKDETLKFPLIKFKNIYIFPGIPKFLKETFYIIEKFFQKTSILLKRVYIQVYETKI